MLFLGHLFAVILFFATLVGYGMFYNYCSKNPITKPVVITVGTIVAALLLYIFSNIR